MDLESAQNNANGNSFKPVPRTTTNADGTFTSTIPGPVTTEEKAHKKNDVKARSMLLIDLPNEHLLTFSKYKDAKTLFEAIQARFGGNDATKKTQRTLLKQMYKNFNAPSTDLPSEWNTHVVVWKNKADLDTMSIDDLYNNFKIVKQEVKRIVVSSSSLGSQNMAFLSSPGSINEVDTASNQVSDVSTLVSIVSSHDNTANLSDATVYFRRTSKKITINGSDTVGYDKTKVECFNCHKMGHFARECRSPRNQKSKPRNQDSSRKTINVEDTSSKAMVAIDGTGFDWSYMVDDEVLTNIDLMAFSDSKVQNSKTCSNTCLKSFETLKTQYDNLRIEFNKSEFDLATYKRGLASVEEQLVFYKKNEGAPQDALKDQGYFDSGCSRHITGNISYLTNFKEHDGGNVAFGGGAKGGKITGKGTIRTATKDKTSRILKSFITEIENLVEKKVRIIRCDNGTKFKNKVMNEFCTEKGIKRNTVWLELVSKIGLLRGEIRTLIEAARTMLADSKLPITFWAEAVNIACYVQNSVLVVKPHFKTPYELFKEWLFDIDALLKSMNYAPVPVGTNSIDFTASNGNNKDKHGPSQVSESDDQEGPNTDSSTKTVNTDGPVNTATPTYDDYPNDPLMPDLKDVGIFDEAYDDRDEEEVYVSQPSGFVDPEFPDRVYKVEKALYRLHQAPRAWLSSKKDGIFLSHDKYVSDILKKFGFSSVKSASTPMETHKPLLKDAAGTDVDVHLYRYLKGQPTLGLWYPKDLPLELIAYCDNDYSGASLDRKSITGGCQFLGSRLISWQCKKQTIVAISTTKAKYIAASNCCGQCNLCGPVYHSKTKHIEVRHHSLEILIRKGLKLNGYLINDGYAELVQHAAWNSSTQEMVINSPCLTDKKELAIPGQTATGKELSNLLMIKTVNDNVRLQALIDRKKVVITEASIRHDLKLNDAEGTSCLPNAMIFEELARMGYEKPSESLLSLKLSFHHNGSSSFIPSYNHILDNLKKNLEAGVPLYMFPRKHKPRRKEKKERKEIEVSPTGLPIEDPVPTPFSDPFPSGEDSMPHKELMVLCTNLSNKVLDLENEVIEMKSSHQAKIAVLESRVEKLKEENRSLTKKLKSFNSKVKSLAVKETVIDKEKSSKQGRKIADIDADVEVNLENVYNLDLAYKETGLSMHDATDADGKEIAEEMVEVITTAKIIVDEVSTAGGELNAAGEEPISVAPINITTAQPSEATKTTVDISTAPNAKGIVFHDMEELATRTSSLKTHVKDKGNAKLVEEPKVLKSRKAQIVIDEEVARRIEAEWNANMQDNIDWNEVVEKVQSRQSDAVRKYQALKRKPMSVAQARKNMMIYLKNMAGFKMEFFKGMSYEEIRPLFKEEYNKVQTLFKEGPEIDAERIKAPRKRTRKENVEKYQTAKKQKGNELEKENAEKQNLEEQQEAEELKRNLEIVPDDEDDVFVHVTPLSSKPLTIVDYKIYKKGNKEHFQIIRANRNYQMYLAFSTMLKNFDTEDLEVLWKIVKDRFNKSQPKEVLDVFLWHTLKVMFEHFIEDSVWKLQKGSKGLADSLDWVFLKIVYK
nr:hypothetical protein [Tanacetum cinerariifolium]